MDWGHPKPRQGLPPLHPAQKNTHIALAMQKMKRTINGERIAQAVKIGPLELVTKRKKYATR